MKFNVDYPDEYIQTLMNSIAPPIGCEEDFPKANPNPIAYLTGCTVDGVKYTSFDDQRSDCGAPFFYKDKKYLCEECSENCKWLYTKLPAIKNRPYATRFDFDFDFERHTYDLITVPKLPL